MALTANPTGIHPMNILIIDDNGSESTLIAAKLRHMGHRVGCSGSGSDGLRQLFDAAHDYDLILLDVLMPDMDGFETARRIRTMEKEMAEEWHPIIFLSSRIAPGDIVAGISAGGDDYLSKPVHTRVLEAKIQAMQRIADMRGKLLETQRQLRIQADTDELTGLPNRRRFIAMLESEIARAQRHDSRLSLAYLDIDHFKRVNDRYGHKAGDDALRAVAAAFAQSLRAQDFIGRLGGEEFCICMPAIGLREAAKACERYRCLIQGIDIRSDELSFSVTASLGVTAYSPEADDMSSFMARADTAVYRAKHAGRNRVEAISIEIADQFPFTAAAASGADAGPRLAASL